MQIFDYNIDYEKLQNSAEKHNSSYLKECLKFIDNINDNFDQFKRYSLTFKQKDWLEKIEQKFPGKNINRDIIK